MADPIELTIFNHVLTTLRTITVANGYHSEVASDSVAEGIKLWDEVHTEEQCPYIGVAIRSQKNTEQAASELHPDMRVTMVAHVYNETSTVTAALKLQDDIIAAMYADHRRDENAIDSNWIDTLFDFRDPHRGGRALMEMHWDITYPRTTAGTA